MSIGDYSLPALCCFCNQRHPADMPCESRSAKPGHKGMKLARFDLLPYDALWVVAKIFGMGARKYAARNWERGYDWSKSFAAVQRHLALWWQGEDRDTESGLSHLAHAVVNLLFLMAFEIRGVGVDDRTKCTSGMNAECTNPEDIQAARDEVEKENA